VRFENRHDGIVFGHNNISFVFGFIAGDKLSCGLAVCHGVFTPLFTATKTGIFQSGNL
jgi:hypothetical protein